MCQKAMFRRCDQVSRKVSHPRTALDVPSPVSASTMSSRLVLEGHVLFHNSFSDEQRSTNTEFPHPRTALDVTSPSSPSRKSSRLVRSISPAVASGSGPASAGTCSSSAAGAQVAVSSAAAAPPFATPCRRSGNACRSGVNYRT